MSTAHPTRSIWSCTTPYRFKRFQNGGSLARKWNFRISRKEGKKKVKLFLLRSHIAMRLMGRWNGALAHDVDSPKVQHANEPFSRRLDRSEQIDWADLRLKNFGESQVSKCQNSLSITLTQSYWFAQYLSNNRVRVCGTTTPELRRKKRKKKISGGGSPGTFATLGTRNTTLFLGKSDDPLGPITSPKSINYRQPGLLCTPQNFAQSSKFLGKKCLVIRLPLRHF